MLDMLESYGEKKKQHKGGHPSHIKNGFDHKFSK